MTLAQHLRWQLPYEAFCYAYFPVTVTRRLIDRRKRSYAGLDPLVRRFWDRWGVLQSTLRDLAARSAPIWMSMNSGGEAVMSLSMLKALRVEQDPFVLSTEAYDSFQLLCRTYSPAKTFFVPWDLGLSVRRVLRQLRPRAFVCVQNAYVPILLREARRAKVKTILVNGLLSRNVERGDFRMSRALALGFHRELDAIAVQSEEDFEAFRKLGVEPERMVITGDIATDLEAVRLTPAERLRLRRELGLADSDPVLIAGSAHPGELQILLDAFLVLRRHLPLSRLIVAPRWLHEARPMADAFTAKGFQVVMKTELATRAGQGAPAYDVLFLDTFGELRTVYAAADVAFIGSSLIAINERGGGHNPLEPLTHGVVPLFGPHMNLWPAIVRELRQVWPALEVNSAEQLAQRAAQVLSGEGPMSAIRDIGRRLVARSGGAVERAVDFLRTQLGLTAPVKR